MFRPAPILLLLGLGLALKPSSLRADALLLGGIGGAMVQDNLGDNGSASVIVFRLDAIFAEANSRVLWPIGVSHVIHGTQENGELNFSFSFIDFAAAYRFGDLATWSGFLGGGGTLLLDYEQNMDLNLDPSLGLLFTAGVIRRLGEHTGMELGLRQRLCNPGMNRGDVTESANAGGPEISLTVGAVF